MASKAFRAGNRDLLRHTHRLLANGAIPKPLWYDAVVKHPPIAAPPKQRIKEIVFPEDKLLKRYYEKNPTAIDEVIKTHEDTSTLPAAIFVSKQVDLMNGGMSEDEAYKVVEEETMKAELPESAVVKHSQETVSLKEAFDNWVDAETEFWQKSNKNLTK